MWAPAGGRGRREQSLSMVHEIQALSHLQVPEGRAHWSCDGWLCQGSRALRSAHLRTCA